MRGRAGLERDRRVRNKREALKSEREKAMNQLAYHPESVINVTTACYKDILLNKDGWMMSQGIAYWIRGKSLGAGVYEIRLVVKD